MRGRWAVVLVLLLLSACRAPTHVEQLPPGVADGVRTQASLCDQGIAPGCYALAWAYLASDEVIGLPKDEVRAAELFAKTCQLGMQEACVRAEELAAGRPVSMTPPAE